MNAVCTDALIFVLLMMVYRPVFLKIVRLLLNAR